MNLSSYAIPGATGVILNCVCGAVGQNVGFRNNGSTDNRIEFMIQNSQFGAVVGLDASGILEVYIGSTAYNKVYLMGFLQSEGVFFTNGIDKSLVTTASWTDISIASDTGSDIALGAFIEVVNPVSFAFPWGFRRNGSTDTLIGGVRWHACAMVGVDGAEILEAYIVNANTDFYLLGYIRKNATFNTNLINRTPATSTFWENLAGVSSNVEAMIYLAFCSTVDYFGLRFDGSSTSIIQRSYTSVWEISANMGSGIEGYIASANVAFYEVGALSDAVLFSGNVTASSQAYGSMKSQVKTAGVAASQGTSLGSLGILVTISASTASFTTTGGLLKRQLRMVGMGASQGTSLGTLRILVRMYASVASLATAGGLLKRQLLMSGMGVSQDTSLGILRILVRIFANAAGIATVDGSLQRQLKISGITVDQSASLGSLGILVTMSADVVGLTTVSGLFRKFSRFIGVGQSIDGLLGTIEIQMPLSGVVPYISSTIGLLSADVILGGSIGEVGEISGQIHLVTETIRIWLAAGLQTAVGQDFEFWSGENIRLAAQAVDDAGKPLPLSGTAITWEAQRDLLYNTRVISKSGIVIDAREGRFEITLEPSDTDGLHGYFYHECRMADFYGNIITLFVGRMNIRPSIDT